MAYKDAEYNQFAAQFVNIANCLETTNFKYLMPGDEMGPDQVPFNYNWHKIDTKIKENDDSIFSIQKELTDYKQGQSTTILGIQNSINDIKDKYALKTELPNIPTMISAFTNDKNYITIAEVEAKNYLTSFEETDPTVPAWAKEATKPSYDISEINDTENNKSLAALIAELQSEIGTLKEKISKLEGGAVE